MRIFVSLLIGLLIGAFATVIGLSYLQKATSYHDGVMAVISAQMRAMENAVKANRCADTDLIPSLQTMRALGNDLEPAFLPTEDDKLFSDHAANYRAAVDEALFVTPMNCLDANKMLDNLSTTCKTCHQDFKH